MKQADLRRYDVLYRNAHYMGASATLRRHLGVDAEYVVPLSLTHGVDFGHVDPCQDIATVEPIHWAHNARIYAAAIQVKSAVAIPHPFMFTMKGGPQRRSGGRTLIVGPPPGPENDQRLQKALAAELGLASGTVLVKPRSNYRGSIEFWRAHGFETVTMLDFGAPSYETVAAALEPFATIVSGTFSSVNIFAAALGRTVKLLRGYHYRSFDLIEFRTRYETIDWQSPVAAQVVRSFADGDPDQVTELAQDILGASLAGRPDRLRAELDAAIADLKTPVFSFRRRSSLRIAAAARLKKPGLVRMSLSELLRAQLGRRVYARDLNEVDAWMNGLSSTNCAQTEVRYVAGETDPGEAVERYGR